MPPSKLRRAQTAAEARAAYAERLTLILRHCIRGATSPCAYAFLPNRQGSVHPCLVCTGARGLCGAFTRRSFVLRGHALKLYA